VALGVKGSLSVELIPNAGATPAGVYYSVVYQVGPGQVKTEYWVVPSTSPANLATVRATPGSGIAAQPVSMQYVNSALATKADDSSVVHVNGAETISGTKTFSSAPNVPAPSGTGSVVNKAYVDQAVANVGAGSYLSTAGGTVTGPITLAGNALATVDAIAAREIVNPEEFRAGISKIIDGTVTCLNASTWAKGGGAKSLGSSAVSN
jgi:hypothetical protein